MNIKIMIQNHTTFLCKDHYFSLSIHINPADHFYQLFYTAVSSLASFPLKPTAKPLNNNLYTLMRI